MAVLEKNGVDVTLPAQRCCGMPYLDGGAVKEAKRAHRGQRESLAERCARAREIVVPGPTCSYMLKQEYPWLDGSEDANLVAAHTRDLFEYLAALHARAASTRTSRTRRGDDRLPAALPPEGPEHGHPLRRRAAPHRGAVEVIERCSAVDGTWGMKKEYFELSMKLAEPLFKDDRAAARPRRHRLPAGRAADRARGRGGRRSIPIQILAEAYGLDGGCHE